MAGWLLMVLRLSIRDPNRVRARRILFSRSSVAARTGRIQSGETEDPPAKIEAKLSNDGLSFVIADRPGQEGQLCL